MLGELIFDVYVLSGDDGDTNLYITSSSIAPYIVKRVCGEDKNVTKIKTIYAWELKKFANREDTILIDMHKSFARFFDGGFLVPPFVRQVMDIEKPLDEAIKIADNDLRKMQKYNYEISHDLEKLKFFYERMYIPYIKKRYGDSAYIEHFDDIEKILKRGELLFIKLGDKCVSGALCEIDGDAYICRKNGILDESFIKRGGLIATYYFPILRAKQINAKVVDFGQSRSFLSDGVLQHKSYWGTRICEDKTINNIIYLKKIPKDPFICIEDKRLKAVVFSEEDKFVKGYIKLGLEFKVV